MLVSLLILFTMPGMLRASETSDLVDSYFAQWNKPDSPGCVVGAMKDGKVVHEKGYGMANLEHGIAITSQTAFYLGSTSKEFTAMAVLMLVAQGRMKLEDPIRKLMPDLPAYMQPVTVRHLLEHTSGIRDYHGLWTLSGPADDAPLRQEQVFEMLRRQKGLQFAPGDEFLYSNSNYFLLASILRPVAFRTLPELAKETIFQPLGLTHTLYYSDRFWILPKRATGYSQGESAGEGAPAGSYRINTATIDIVGDGGVFTTLEDVFKWFQVMENPKGLHAQALELMRTPARLNSGDLAEYGRGLMLKSHRGMEAYSHAGGLRGYRSEILWIPSKKLGVACLCNTSGITPAIFARLVADIFLGEIPAPERPALTAQQIVRKVGSFYDPVTGDLVQIFPQGPNLIFSYNGTQMRIAPKTPMLFRSVNAPLDVEVEFREAGDRDEPRFFRVESETNRPVKWERIDPKPVVLTEPRQYEGVYHCDEAQSQIVIRFADGKLLLEQGLNSIGELQLVRPDQFRLGTMFLACSRGADKRITGFRLNTGRVRGLEFTRTSDQPPN